MRMHVAYLRSLEDSERVRAACVKYLQNWLIHFYPERTAIVRQAEQMARDLGGQLEAPRLSWKYSWIKALFGWGPTKRAQLFLPRMRSSLARHIDKALFRIEKHSCARNMGI